MFSRPPSLFTKLPDEGPLLETSKILTYFSGRSKPNLLRRYLRSLYLHWQLLYMCVARPILSALSALDAISEDGEPDGPDPETIKAMLEDALVMLGNANARLNGWRQRRFSEFLTKIGNQLTVTYSLISSMNEYVVNMITVHQLRRLSANPKNLGQDSTVPGIRVEQRILDNGSSHPWSAQCGSRPCINPHTEWMLDKAIFKKISVCFFAPEIDLFASRLNHQVPSMCLGTQTQVDDSRCFSAELGQMEEFYSPTVVLLSRIIQKVRQDKATRLLVVPNWSGQLWYPELCQMLIDHPLQLPIKESLLTLPF